MAGYFNDIVGGIVPITYTWDAIDAESETWADLLTWADGSGGYSSISSIGVPDIEFYTGIIDFGRIDWVNPLITVVGQGDIVTKVWASETQPSDYISGEPGIIADSVKAIDALYGRYFQFKIEIYNDSAQTAQLKQVTTNLSVATQSEFFQENSGTHTGTETTRILPIERQYSKLLNISGHARLIGINPDSTLSYTEAVGDYTGTITPTIVGTPFTTTAAGEYKYTGIGIRFNNDTGSALLDTNDAVWIPLTSRIGSGHFHMSGWIKSKKMTWLDGVSSPPNYAHSDYFFHLDTGGTDIYLRTFTSNTHIAMSYSFNGSSWTTIGEFTFGRGPGDDWYYWSVSRGDPSSSTIVFKFHTFEKGGITYSQDLTNATVKIGDLGSGTVGSYWMDDVHITDEYNFNPNVPGAEQTVYNSTIFLMNGKTLETITTSNIPIVTVGALTDRTEPRYAVYRASGEPVDADVALQVTGLKGMNCDGAGSITEVA